MWGWLDNVISGLSAIFQNIVSIPETIIKGLKDIFIPDMEVIKDQFNDMILSVESSFGLVTDSIDNFQNAWEEKPVNDVKGNYTINGLGTLNITFLDSKYLKQGVDFFRPILRGFLVLMLLFYNYKMILSFLGQDPNIAHHTIQNYNEFRKGGKE